MSTVLKLFCYLDLFFYYTDFLFSRYSTAVGQNYVNHSFCYLRCNAFDRPINKVYVQCLFEKFTHRIILQEFYPVYQNFIDRSGKYSLGESFIDFFKFQKLFCFSVDISLCNSEYKHHMSRGGMEWSHVAGYSYRREIKQREAMGGKFKNSRWVVPFPYL